jgi:hypothetical protein
MIPPAEYRLAISIITSEAVAISRGDLVVETARFFGFDRTGSDLKEANSVKRLSKWGDCTWMEMFCVRNKLVEP